MLTTEPKIPPIHPGVYLAELLKEFSISQENLAKMLDISPTRVSYIVSGRRPIKTDMAFLLGKLFSQSPQYWLNLQMNYDLDNIDPVFKDKLDKTPCLFVNSLSEVSLPDNEE